MAAVTIPAQSVVTELITWASFSISRFFNSASVELKCKPLIRKEWTEIVRELNCGAGFGHITKDPQTDYQI